MSADNGNYVKLEDIREEGVTEEEAGNKKILRAIHLSESQIEKLTGRWFYPRTLKLRVDGSGSKGLFIGPPIITITRIDLLLEPIIGQPPVKTEVSLETIRIFNRHLTMGLTDPDDRDNPHIMLEDFDIATIGRFPKRSQNVILEGVFGFTELGPGEAAGETIDNSQVPLSQGVTPPAIIDATIRLVVRNLAILGDLDDVEDRTRRWQVKKYKTRDQEIEFDTKGGSNFGALTGDRVIDAILADYVRMPAMRMV